MTQRKYGWQEFCADMHKSPNWITSSRIVGFFFFLLPLLWQGYLSAAFIVFILLATTDYFDGWLARRRNIVTWLGKGLDPIADKVLLIGTMLALGLLDTYPNFGSLIVMLESALLTIGVMAFFGFYAAPPILGANLFGKAKAVLEIVIISLVFIQRLNIFLIGNDLIIFLFWAVILSAAMSILGHLRMLEII